MPHSSFEDLNLSPAVLKALQQERYETPTPIQLEAIPAILQKKDLLACARTGTGKTAAFALPVIHLLEQEPEASVISALILCPTRELAVQIGESFSAYGSFTSLKNEVIFGGVPIEDQVAALQSGTNILIATPGRLLDLQEKGYVDLSGIQLLILDEADRMLDMGFREDLIKIIAALPLQKQTLLFSATLSAEIGEFAASILDQPVKVEVSTLSAADNIKQSVYFLEKKDKPALLSHVLKNKEIKRVLVFTRTKTGADDLVKVLEKARIKVAAIHGNKSQDARQRALDNFKDGSIRVLVATDVAARGIDIDDLQYVINYELPIQPETYVHRIGRTGRAGNEGVALSFCEPEELQYLKDIKETIGQDIPFADHPYQLSVKSYTKPSIVLPQASPKRTAAPKKSAGKNKSKRRGYSRA